MNNLIDNFVKCEQCDNHITKEIKHGYGDKVFCGEVCLRNFLWLGALLKMSGEERQFFEWIHETFNESVEISTVD